MPFVIMLVQITGHTMKPKNISLQIMNVSHCSEVDKVPSPYPPVPDVQETTDSHFTVPDIYMTTDFQSPVPDVSMTTDFHSQVPDIYMTTDTEFSVGTVTSRPIAYPESVTTEVEARGERVTREPWATTMVPPLSFSPTAMETITEDVIAVATVQPALGYEVPRDNVSVGE